MVEGDELLVEANIARVFTMNPQLKFIGLRCCSSSVRHLTATAILRSVEYLQCICLPDHSQISVEDMQVLLSHAPNVWCDTLTVLSVPASEFLGVQWASLSLWQFRCIFCVPRPDNHMPANYQDSSWNSPTIEQSHQIQRQAYHHTAQQTNLTELHLGASVNHDDPECLWYSLEMTLESRLDELVGLKELCTLSLHYMKHHVRPKELDWIVKNFPRFVDFTHGVKIFPRTLSSGWTQNLFHLRMLNRRFFFLALTFSLLHLHLCYRAK